MEEIKQKEELVYTIREQEACSELQEVIVNNTTDCIVRVYQGPKGRTIHISNGTTGQIFQEAADFIKLRAAAIMAATAFEEGYIESRSEIGLLALKQLQLCVKEHRQEHYDEEPE